MFAGSLFSIPYFSAFQLLIRPKKHGGLFDHYGVRWWDDTPVHRYDLVTDFNDDRGVAPVVYTEFEAARPVTVEIDFVAMRDRPDIAHRLSLFHVFRFGDVPMVRLDYDLLAANCEHFARYVITNKWECKQLERSRLAQVILLGKRIFGSRFPDPLPPTNAGQPLAY